MAVTFVISNTKREAFGNLWKIFGTIVASGTYTTNGDALTGAQIGLARIDDLKVTSAAGFSPEYDYTNSKLKHFGGGGQAAHTHDFKVIGGQAAAGTDALSAKTLTLGKEAATDITIAGANSATLGGVVATAASGGASTEIANGATVAYTARFEATGI